MAFFRVFGRGAVERLGHRTTDGGLNLSGKLVGATVAVTVLFGAAGAFREHVLEDIDPRCPEGGTLCLAWDSAVETGKFAGAVYEGYIEPAFGS